MPRHAHVWHTPPMHIDTSKLVIIPHDEVPAWLLAPLPPDIDDAVDILRAACRELEPHLERPFRLRYWRAYRHLLDAIYYLSHRRAPTDEEFLREMGSTGDSSYGGAPTDRSYGLVGGKFLAGEEHIKPHNRPYDDCGRHHKEPEHHGCD